MYVFSFFCYTAFILIRLKALWIDWTYSIRRKAEKDLILDNWLLIVTEMKLKSAVHNVCFCVTLFQNLLFSIFS